MSASESLAAFDENTRNLLLALTTSWVLPPGVRNELAMLAVCVLSFELAKTQIALEQTSAYNSSKPVIFLCIAEIDGAEHRAIQAEKKAATGSSFARAPRGSKGGGEDQNGAAAARLNTEEMPRGLVAAGKEPEINGLNPRGLSWVLCKGQTIMIGEASCRQFCYDTTCSLLGL